MGDYSFNSVSIVAAIIAVILGLYYSSEKYRAISVSGLPVAESKIVFLVSALIRQGRPCRLIAHSLRSMVASLHLDFAIGIHWESTACTRYSMQIGIAA